MSNIIGSLGKTIILNEANDDIFDIDKEVDAQIKRVENRIAKKNAQQEEQQQSPSQEQEENNNINEENNQEEEPDSTDVNNQEDDNNIPEETNVEDDQQEDQDDNYIDNQQDNIPDDYEPKQTIPELKILSTLSDNEYKLSNIKVMEQFRELNRNVSSFINNILMTITTKTSRQRQIVNIVHKNLYDMKEDINNYILYRDNGVYEENSIAYLTYLKRYQIATNIIKSIIEENIKSFKDDKK